jgi:hypothetical protein
MTRTTTGPNCSPPVSPAQGPLRIMAGSAPLESAYVLIDQLFCARTDYLGAVTGSDCLRHERFARLGPSSPRSNRILREARNEMPARRAVRCERDLNRWLLEPESARQFARRLSRTTDRQDTHGCRQTLAVRAFIEAPATVGDIFQGTPLRRPGADHETGHRLPCFSLPKLSN